MNPRYLRKNLQCIPAGICSCYAVSRNVAASVGYCGRNQATLSCIVTSGSFTEQNEVKIKDGVSELFAGSEWNSQWFNKVRGITVIG